MDKPAWNEEIFIKNWKFADLMIIMKKIMEKDSQDKIKLEINKHYPIYKDLFGVKIESGNILIKKSNIDEAIELLNLFIEIKQKSKNKFIFLPLNNFNGVVQIAEKLGLEKPEFSAVQGYILNNELVNFIREEQDFIKLKFKDNPENIFYIYKLYFFQYKNDLFLVIEKNI